MPKLHPQKPFEQLREINHLTFPEALPFHSYLTDVVQNTLSWRLKSRPFFPTLQPITSALLMNVLSQDSLRAGAVWNKFQPSTSISTNHTTYQFWNLLAVELYYYFFKSFFWVSITILFCLSFEITKIEC